MLPAIEDKFLNTFEPGPEDECWFWKGYVNTFHGYGQFCVGKRIYYAHRISYELFNGPIPAGFVVRHSCDNPSCANPKHLLVGTHKQNAHDSIQRDRNAYGSRVGTSKLKEADVRQIKDLIACGKWTHKEIGKAYRVTGANITAIKTGKSWRQV